MSVKPGLNPSANSRLNPNAGMNVEGCAAFECNGKPVRTGIHET